MNRLFYKISFAFFMLSAPFGAFALNFSVDSIRAFDGKWWNGGYGDDSVIVTNKANYAISIDSIFIQIDTSIYKNFDIGWRETVNGLRSTIGFYNDSISHSGCHNFSSNLNDYNNGKSSKISLATHSAITIFSPYFSTTCSMAGVIVDCFNDLCDSPNFVIDSSFFHGRIIFVSNKHRDTLNLLCKRERKTTAVINRTAVISPILHSGNQPLVNVLGRKTGLANKLTAYHTLSIRKGNISILR